MQLAVVGASGEFQRQFGNDREQSSLTIVAGMFFVIKIRI